MEKRALAIIEKVMHHGGIYTYKDAIIALDRKDVRHSLRLPRKDANVIKDAQRILSKWVKEGKKSSYEIQDYFR